MVTSFPSTSTNYWNETHTLDTQSLVGEGSGPAARLSEFPSSTVNLSRRGFDSGFSAKLDNVLSEGVEMLQLTPDWDGHGAAEILESTYDRAVGLCRKVSANFDQVAGVKDLDLELSPGADGSVSIHWLGEGKELLILSLPDSESMPFYGDNQVSGDSIKGSISSLDSASWLACWLAE